MYAFKPHVLTARSLYSITKPEGRMDVILCCDGKNLYFNDNPELDSEFHNIWEYNLAGQQWRLLSSIRRLYKSPDLITYDVIAGTAFESNYLVISTLQDQYSIQRTFNDELSSPTCQLHVCDLKSKRSLVRRTSGQIPNRSVENNFIRHGKYLYFVGIEKDYETSYDVYKLNMENDVWEVVYTCRGLDANEPVNGSDHTLVYSNNMIYIFGDCYHGTIRESSFSFLKISAFDLEKSCWKMIDTYGDENHTPQYPADRQAFGITSYTDPDSGEINVIISGGADFQLNINGGHIIDESGYFEFDDVWRLNLTNLKWTCLERFGTVLPSHVNSHSTSISPAGKLFIFDQHISDNDK
ncbi:kelch domain-containing protein 10 homolog [Microplitis mediator]|uniref:kelch domain-containing protein 10 homolog n=1 Tax=Microplitis mediator TaxID=375433 RepID=UPI0025542FC9|nr:kelch domain-containing protein 10 homolog [Microplitis mediator]